MIMTVWLLYSYSEALLIFKDAKSAEAAVKTISAKKGLTAELGDFGDSDSDEEDEDEEDSDEDEEEDEEDEEMPCLFLGL